MISGAIYSGPGPGSLIAASQSWASLAAELESAAQAYTSVVSQLTLSWTGPSSATMVSSLQPYVAWVTQTSAYAAQMAASASSAAAAFETVHASVVPPPEIAANRALQMMLIATNVLGQNTPAIAATEANYLRMWAQDIAAMIAYATSSSTITTTLPQATPAPQVATPQSMAPSASAPGTAQSTVSGLGTWQDWVNGFGGQGAGSPPTLLGDLGAVMQSNGINSIMSGDLLFGAPMGVIQGIAALTALSMATSGGMGMGALALGGGTEGSSVPVSGGAGGASRPPSFSMGQSTRVGSLSAPPSWGSAVAGEGAATADSALVTAVAEGETLVPLGLPMPVPLGGGAPRAEGEKKRGRWSQYDDLEFGDKPGAVIFKHPSGG